VIAVPGLTPRSPTTMVGPVLVTVEPPNTAKVCAVPNEGAAWANAVCSGAMVKRAVRKAVAISLAATAFNFCISLREFFNGAPCTARWSSAVCGPAPCISHSYEEAIV